mgnify:CR=1 FL=1
MQAYEEEYFKSQRYSEKEEAVKELYLYFLKWAHADHGKGKSALDVGASLGYVVRLLEELGYNSVGLEISQYACEHSGLGERMIHGDAESFAFEPCSLDLVTCFEVVEHLQNPKAALARFHEVLKHDGRLVVTTPTHFGSFISRQNKHHPSVKSWHEWVALLDEVGFSEHRHESYGMTPRILGRYRVTMNPWPAPATHIVFEATK